MADAPVPGLAAQPTRWWLTLDAVIVVLFVVVGRDTHQESQTALDIIETAAPFLWALLAGWAAMRAWRDPISVRTGSGVAGITIVVGVLLRRFVYGDGIATPFIIVTALFLLATMLGWRVLVGLWRRRARDGRPASADAAVDAAADSDGGGVRTG